MIANNSTRDGSLRGADAGWRCERGCRFVRLLKAVVGASLRPKANIGLRFPFVDVYFLC